MSSFLIRILVVVAALWFFQRFLRSLGGAPKRTAPRAGSNDLENYMVKDPVCGMYMDSRLALRVERGKDISYFCSEACMKEYLESGRRD